MEIKLNCSNPHPAEQTVRKLYKEAHVKFTCGGVPVIAETAGNMQKNNQGFQLRPGSPPKSGYDALKLIGLLSAAFGQQYQSFADIPAGTPTL